MNRGTLYAAGAYILWGLLPLYWKALPTVSALEILSHRVVWALVVTLLLVAYRGRWQWLGAFFTNRRTALTFIGSALLLTFNWFVYIWAVKAGYIIETSLGYFINPLINVLLGVLFLRERLRMGQAAAIAIAAGGVLYLTVQYGALPWIALALASSFGLYGLLRKTATLGSLEGLTLETLLIAPAALIYLLALERGGTAAFAHSGVTTTLLLLFAGVVTSAPLLLFAAAARRITLTTLGLLQYIAPTIQFTLGVLVFGEQLTPQRLVGFCLIWLALAIYTAENLLQGRGPRAALRAAPRQ